MPKKSVLRGSIKYKFNVRWEQLSPKEKSLCIFVLVNQNATGYPMLFLLFAHMSAKDVPFFAEG